MTIHIDKNQYSLTNNPQAEIAFKKPVPLKVDFAKTNIIVETLEGPVTCLKGDAIMTGTKGEQWPIPKDKFEKTYTYNPETKTASKVKQLVHVLQIQSPFTIEVSWSKNPLHGKAFDYLVQYGDKDFGIVDQSIFKETYQLISSLHSRSAQ